MEVFSQLLKPLTEWAQSQRAFFAQSLFLIPLFPLIGFFLNGLFGRYFSRRTVSLIAVKAAAASFVWAFLCVLSLPTPDLAKGTWLWPTGVRPVLHIVYGQWLDTDL